MQQGHKYDNGCGKEYFFIAKCSYICEVEPDKQTVLRVH